jgi:hypothetical protein
VCASTRARSPRAVACWFISDRSAERNADERDGAVTTAVVRVVALKRSPKGSSRGLASRHIHGGQGGGQRGMKVNEKWWLRQKSDGARRLVNVEAG